MRRLRWLVLAILVCASASRGDVVYLRNGQRHEGKATTQGDKVIIETSMGTFEVSAAEVLHIAPGPVETRPADTPASAADVRPAGPISAEQASLPEAVVFILMRNLAGTAPGTESYALRQQIERWRVAAHDRKRRVGATWAGPEEFARRRDAYAATLKEAEELLRKARYSSGFSQQSEADQRRALAPAMAKLQAAAQSWPDPQIRGFLSALALYQAGNYGPAEALFRRCAEEQPLVAAFHQGRALALTEGDRALAALEEFVTALDLRPGSRELVQAMDAAMKKVPGARIKDPAYVRAQEVLGEYSDSDRTSLPSYGTSWLMPGREWRVRGESLPVPPYDRLVVRQAVGVPVAPSALLVDAEAVKDAEDLFVQIDANTTAPAVARRSTSYGRQSPPLVTLHVPGWEFTPVELADANYRPSDDRATAQGLVAYAEMQVPLRPVFAKIGPPDANGVVTASGSPGPGEAAAPVFAADGRLVGFLAAKTDAHAEGGGPDRFIPLSQAADVLRQARSTYGLSYAAFGQAKRNVKTRTATGSFFVVRALVGEKLQ